MATSGDDAEPAPLPAEPADESHIAITHPRTIRALNHPARIVVLSELSPGGSATATELARYAGITPSAMSYHLRALARIGLVRRVDSDDGRERPWELVSTSFNVDTVPGTSSAPLAELNETLFEAYRAMMTTSLSVREDMPRPWRNAFMLNPATFRLTAEQAEAMYHDFNQVVERYMALSKHRSPGSRRLHVIIAAAPDATADPPSDAPAAE